MSKTSLSSLLLGLLLIIAVSNVSAKIKQRIIGGQTARRGDYKYQVSLQFITPWGCTHHFCGGSILDQWHIITAAHCVTKKYTHEFDDKKITVVAGTSDLLDKTRSPALYHDVDQIFIPTAWVGSSPLLNDIAILRLKNPLPLGSNLKISAIKLPQPNQYLPASGSSAAIMSGFGSYNQKWVNGKWIESNGSPYLLWVWGFINVSDQNGCDNTQVCVRGANNQPLGGTCYGDSGGPLVDPRTNILIGVTSGSNYDQCGQITKFTRVSSYLNFINNVLRNNFVNIKRKKLSHHQQDILSSYPHCDQSYNP